MDLRMSIFFFSLVLYILYINNKQWKEKYLTSSVFGLLNHYQLWSKVHQYLWSVVFNPLFLVSETRVKECFDYKHHTRYRVGGMQSNAGEGRAHRSPELQEV